ncbi:hypothetical protein BDR04DRAFT_1093163 [Suillus decipiens]|nr:hypothetical protein BDR04DRAFT_1093163 [Suillus decipiens]
MSTDASGWPKVVAVSYGPFIPIIRIGSAVVVLNGTSGSPLTRAFVDSKPLHPSAPLVQLTDPYPRRWVPAAGTKEVGSSMALCWALLTYMYHDISRSIEKQVSD